MVVTIGDESFVGPFTKVQKNAVIGKRTKIQSHCFVCEMVSIGDNCFIGNGVMFINDSFATGDPAAGNKETGRKQILATMFQSAAMPLFCRYAFVIRP
jgi:UDP-3-O-[3-hydroxymyristoyl] glucosamine N-acyltransferase